MKINSIKATLTLMAIAMSMSIFAQKDFQGQAFYMSKTSMDLSGFGGEQQSEQQKARIAERMKSLLEKTFILNFNQQESMYKEEEKLAAPTQGGGGGRGFGGALSAASGPQYKNVKDNAYIQENELMGKAFLVQDDLKPLDWKMGSETKQIGKYTAYKATAEIDAPASAIPSFGRGGRGGQNQAAAGEESKPEVAQKITVVAWYTMQVPINQGPGKYWGLPGLILEVNEGNTTILCTKLVLNTENAEKIKVPSKGKKVTQAEYDKITADKMKELQEQFQGRGGRGGGGGGGRR